MSETEREQIQRAIDLLYQLPSGIDEDADESNLSPDDAVAHISGLVVRILEGLV